MSDERYEVDITVDATRAIAETEKFVAETKKIDTAAKTATASLEKQAAATKKLANAQTAAGRGSGARGTRYADITQKQLDSYNRIMPVQAAYAKQVAALGGQYGDDVRVLQARVNAQKAAAAAQQKATAQSLASQRAQAAAQRAATAAQNKYYTSLSNTRYALYDASQAYIMLAGALAAPALAAVAFSTKYDKAFSSVRRTTLETGQPLAELRQGLVDLTTEMPTSFESIAQIATIGAQLNVATEDLKDFTAVVSMFSATTNTTVDAAAVGLGRLAQLTHTAGSDYENLGSAIYQVGITSVATEQEILNMASEIATSGDLAGFANHEIIALSGALASLGVQPEAARGSLQRIFNVIEQGAANGGASLERLAKISGMTSQDFAKTWGSDAQSAFSSFVSGLDKIQDSGGNTNQMLKTMGITAVRDIRTLQILANNTDVYNNALRQSNDAYESGSALREGFALQMANLADQMTILWQTLGAVADEVGQEFGPALTAIAGSAKAFADGLLVVVRTPIGGWLAAGTVAILAGAAAWFAFQGVMALVKAAIGSLIDSTIGLKQNASILSGGLADLAFQFFHVSSAMNSTSTSAKVASASMGALATETNVATVALTGAEKRAIVAGWAIKGFKALLSSVGIGLALMAIPAAIDAIGYAFSSSADKARSFFGEFDSLDAAFKEDTEAWKNGEKAVHLVSGAFETATTTTSDFTSEIKAAAKGQDTWATRIETTTKKLNEQTIALGKATKESFANELVSGDSGKELARILAENKEALKSTGFSLSTWMDRSLEGTGNAYITQFRAKIEELRAIATTNKNDPNSLQTANNLTALLGIMDRLAGASDVLNEKSKAAANSQEFLAAAGVKVGTAAQEEANGLGEVTGKMSDLVSSAMSGVDATLTINNAIGDLAESLSQNGNAFDTYSEKGRNNLEALQNTLSTLATSAGDDSATFAGNLIGIVEALQSNGVVIGGDLEYLIGLMQNTFGTTWGVSVDSSLARQDLAAFISQTIAALKQRLLLERQNAAAALSLKDWAAYNNATIAAKNAEKQLTSAQSIQAASSKTAEQATKSVAKAHDKQANGAKNAGNASKGLTKTVRTMTDYMSDLKKVLSTAFDIRFGVAQAKRDLADIQEAIVASVESMSAHSEVLSERITATFGASDAQDEITKSVRAIADAYKSAADDVRDATQAILDAQADLADNSANRKIAEYQLSVAEMYGDELRAAEIRAKLVELDAQSAKAQSDLVSAQESLASAQSRTSKTLLGSSDAAVENRSAVEELLDKYIDYAKSVRKSGATQKTTNALIEDARSAFLAQATALGFNSDELATYARAIDPVTDAELEQTKAARETAKQMEDLTDKWTDYILELKNSGASSSAVSAAMKNAKTDIQNLGTQMGLSGTAIAPYTAQIDSIKTAIDRVPKNLTVSFDPDPMKRALAEFDTALDKTQGKASTLKDTLGKLGGGDGGTIKTPEIDDKKLRKLALQAKRLLYLQYAAGYAGKGQTSNYNHWISEAEKIENKINSGSYQQGGFTGYGAASEVAGIVHKGEFVVPKPMVNQSTGLPYADALGRIMRGYQGGGYVTAPPRAASASTSIVELSPTDRALLAAAGNVSIAVDGKVLAATVNKANKNSNIRGQG